MAGMRKRITFPLAGPILLSVVLAACIPATFGGPGPSVVVGDASASVAAAAPVPTPAGPSGRPSFVRPTPMPLPTLLAYVVKRGDTLTSIARAHGTTARSIAFWNRGQHPSLDPDSPSYSPNRIEVGWILLLVPDTELDPEDLPPEPAPSP
jgi:LysM domain-containing protein